VADLTGMGVADQKNVFPVIPETVALTLLRPACTA